MRRASVAPPVTESTPALHASQARFDGAFHHAAIGMALVALDGRLLDVNPALCAMLGYARDELLATSFQPLTHPDDLAADLALVDQLLRGDITHYDLEKRYLHRAGHVVWSILSVSLVRDDDGAPSYFVSQMQDISDRKATEASLARTEQHYQTLIEHIPAVTYIYASHDDAMTLFMSPQIEQLTGYPPSAFVDDPMFWLGIIHPDDRERTEGVIAHTNESGERYQIEHRYVKRNGDIIWVRNDAIAIPAPDGSTQFWHGFLFDITEQKQVESQLRDAEASAAQLAAIVMTSDDAIYATSVDDVVTSWNASAERLFGYTAADMLGQRLDALIPAERGRERQVLIDRVAAGETIQQAETQRQHKDGTLVDVALTVSPLVDEAGAITGYSTIARDISTAKLAETHLKDAEARYRSLVEQLSAVVFRNTVDAMYSPLYISPQIETLIGYTPAEWRDDPRLWERLLHADDRDAVLATAARTNATGEPFRMEYRLVAKDGRIVWVQEDTVLVRDDAGQPLCWQGMFVDVSERKALEAQLAYQALHDSLTNLPNRRYFGESLNDAMGRLPRFGEQLTVLLLDLDNFKVVNDSLGHQAGDDLLFGVAQRLRSAVRADDLVARLGGDEFAVLVANVTDDASVTVVAQRIIASLNEPLAVAGRDVRVGCSIGIAATETPTASLTDLLRRADIAMYQAKARGKNSFVVFSPDMDADARMKLDGERDLRQALDTKQFIVAFQPLVSLKTGAIIGAEALVRWQHPVRGTLGPSEFLPLAEETGLIVPIGLQTLWTACRVAHEVNANHPDVPRVVSVNLSPAQLADADIVGHVEQVLDVTGLAATCLILEITESTIVGDTDTLIETLNQLRALGVRIAIDDFGMGYSSLSHLRHFPVDIVKIDRQFVSGLGHDFNDTVVVSGVNGIAHAMGLTVVAEGIETAEQIMQLFELGCDIGQGYYVSAPCPAAEYVALLTDETWATQFTQSVAAWLRGDERDRQDPYDDMAERSRTLCRRDAREP